MYDGGFKEKNDIKSLSNNDVGFPLKKFLSWSPVFNYKGQRYPLYFSPGLLFGLIKDRPDVVVTEGEINFINNMSIYVYCLFFKKRYVWWSLGKVRTRNKNILNKVLDPIVDFLLHRSSCVMTRTTWAKDYYVNVKMVPERKVIVAPNSMDEKIARSEVDEAIIRNLKSASASRVILYVGALTQHKRPKDLVEAFSILCNKPEFLDCELWFVGDGPEKKCLQDTAERLSVEGKVKFFGKVFKGVGNFFTASDVVVVPGLGGLVINHAMIFGKPVVSRLADGTELDLIVDGETGFLLKDYSPHSMADAIGTVLLPVNLERMSANARSKVDDFWNIETMIKRVNNCVEFSG